jgi:hypothetical protein
MQNRNELLDTYKLVNDQLVIVGSTDANRIGMVIDPNSIPPDPQIVLSIIIDSVPTTDISHQPLVNTRARSLISAETSAKLITMFSNIFCCCKSNSVTQVNERNNIEDTKVCEGSVNSLSRR